MIHCDLAGKNAVAEDVFTSNCLGFLALLGGVDLLSFLGTAKNLQHELFAITADQSAEVTVRFWPFLPGAGIPDAIIDVNTPQRFKVIVEVKHGAAKSGSGENDQLAKYWCAAQRLYHDPCAIVYLTHHRAFPRADIEQSIRQAVDKRKIFWLNWCELFRWCAKQIALSTMRSAVERRILEQLQEYLAVYGYRVFLGWDIPISAWRIDSRRSYTKQVKRALFRQYRRSYGSAMIGGVVPRFMREYKLGDIPHMFPPPHYRPIME